jgi:LPXTG-site transpeptidase (sortase) family protein
LLAVGTPIAVLRIPDLGLKEVVGEGTTSGVLQSGPGHLRSTVFPGGAGTSVVFGRAAAYGGPFGGIAGLRTGARIIVTTGVGSRTFRVVSVRHAGDKIPVLKTKRARLTLVTATGPKFFPTGTVSVDADSTKAALPARAPAIRTVPASEQPLGIDTSTVWALVLWLEALAVVVFLGIWIWHRRSPAHAWLLCLAPLLFVATQVCRQLTLLIPNLT